MKLVTGVKRDVNAAASKFKVRAVVCGNFQRKQANEDLYTANADITSVRAALAAAAEKRFSIKVLDVKTAFLNAHLPDSFETVFIRPPQALVEFGLVAPGTVWRCIKAIYGLRISPKAWGVERDKELKKMVSKLKGQQYILQQSAIDPSVWVILRGGLLPNGGGRPQHPSYNSEEAESGAYGYLVTYVDDFLILGPDGSTNNGGRGDQAEVDDHRHANGEVTKSPIGQDPAANRGVQATLPPMAVPSIDVALLR